MIAIIVTIVLNILVGTPSEEIKVKDKDKAPTTETMTTMGGTGTWTNVDR